jgi:hypothetical protein
VSEHWQEVPRLITQLYEVTDELEERFGRKFTPDGHLMGSLGEAMAVYMYDLVLANPSLEKHDAETKDGKTLVQIKFTAGKSGYGIFSKPQHLIALQLVDRSEVVEIFNGPGEIAWKCASAKPAKNGQHSMAMGRLRKLNAEVADHQRIRRVRDLHLVRRNAHGR